MCRQNKIIFDEFPVFSDSVNNAIERIRINTRLLDHDIRTIMITSVDDDDGKTFVAMNLWKQMADADQKTIIIDADMRNSKLVEEFHLKREDGGKIKGLSHYLNSEEMLEETLFKTNYKEGCIIPNTKNLNDPTLVLESDRLHNMIKQLSNDYKYVFLDTPSIGLFPDAKIIGNLCDGAIMVVRSRHTTRKSMYKVMRKLNIANCSLLGIVLNRV